VTVSEKEILLRADCIREANTIEDRLFQRRKYNRELTISEKEILSRADCIREGNTIED
jgi:hypothetical protein